MKTPENNLSKGEDPEAYKKLAEKGMMVAFPAKIRGQDKRPDIGIPYHSTVKFFNTDKDTPEQVHETANKLQMNPPDPKNTHIEPGIFKDRFGNDVHVLKLHGPHAEEIKEHHSKFAHLGHEEKFAYHPHVSVDKATWQKIVDSKAKTAHEAGIEFGPAELRQGHNVLATYKKSEEPSLKKEELEKGALKHIATTLGVVGALASQTALAPTHSSPEYTRNKMLNTISQVESSGGKDTSHKAVGGLHHGESAYGKYAIMPNTIRETIKMNRDLKSKHGKAAGLMGQELHNYMEDHPGLDRDIADRHLARLEHHFGNNPILVGYGWNQGVNGTHKALNEKKDIGSHPYSQKIKEQYLKEK